MSEAPFQVNCIGYVRHQLGLDPVERFVDDIDLTDLLVDFSVVCDTAPAVAIAIQSIRIKENDLGGPNLIAYCISHMAIIDPANPGMIFHRKGMDRPICHEPIDI